jgi:hypothetical protein
MCGLHFSQTFFQKLVAVYIAKIESTVSQPCFFLQNDAHLGTYHTAHHFCMPIGMSGPACHSSSCKFIISLSKQGQISGQPVNHGNQNTFNP